MHNFTIIFFYQCIFDKALGYYMWIKSQITRYNFQIQIQLRWVFCFWGKTHFNWVSLFLRQLCSTTEEDLLSWNTLQHGSKNISLWTKVFGWNKRHFLTIILNLSPRSECNSHDEKAMPTGTIALNIHNFKKLGLQHACRDNETNPQVLLSTSTLYT